MYVCGVDPRSDSREDRGAFSDFELRSMQQRATRKSAGYRLLPAFQIFVSEVCTPHLLSAVHTGRKGVWRNSTQPPWVVRYTTLIFTSGLGQHGPPPDPLVRSGSHALHAISQLTGTWPRSAARIYCGVKQGQPEHKKAKNDVPPASLWPLGPAFRRERGVGVSVSLVS